MDALLAIVVIAGAYLVGSIPTSYLVGRLVKGVDIRELGSKNVGTSNLSAQVGAWWAVREAVGLTPLVGFMYEPTIHMAPRRAMSSASRSVLATAMSCAMGMSRPSMV